MLDQIWTQPLHSIYTITCTRALINPTVVCGFLFIREPLLTRYCLDPRCRTSILMTGNHFPHCARDAVDVRYFCACLLLHGYRLVVYGSSTKHTTPNPQKYHLNNALLTQQAYLKSAIILLHEDTDVLIKKIARSRYIILLKL